MSLRQIFAQARVRWDNDSLTDPQTAAAFVDHVLTEAGPARKLAAVRRMAALARALEITLPLPIVVARRRVPAPARPADWPAKAERVLQAAELLDRALARRPRGAETCAALALASAILRSGLTRPEAWPAFLRAITTSQPFGQAPALGGLVWLTLDLPRRAGRLAQHDTKEVLRVFLDTTTLSLIARARGALVPNMSPNAGLQMAMTAIGADLCLDDVQCAGFAAIEDRAPQRIPSVLFEVARGAVASFSAPEPVWASMLSGVPMIRRPQKSPSVAPPPAAKVALDVELSVLRLRAALLATGGPKPARTLIRTALTALLAAYPVPMIRGLTLWMIDLEAEKYAVSSLQRYGLPLAAMLGPLFENRDPAMMPPAELECLIEEALEGVMRGERAYRAARIAQFFQFAARDPRLGWPEISLEVEASAKPRVRAALIGPDLLKRALNAFAGDLVAQAAVLLGARGGLRLSDMEALRLGDIETAEGGMVMIHQTQWGNLKSSAARRMVPLAALLAHDELRIWRRFCALRASETTSPTAAFLASGGGVIPEERFDRARFAKQLMEGAGLRPHDLRHGALSNLTLLVLAPEGVVGPVTGWGSAQQRALRAMFCGVDAWGGMRQIARLAGHRDPATTLESYIHLNDLALGLHLVAAAEPIDKTLAARTLGLNQRSLPAGKSLSVERLRPQIIAKLPRVMVAPPVVQSLPEPKPETMTVALCLKVEALITRGLSAPDIAAKLNLAMRIVNAQIACARVGRLRAKRDEAAAVALAHRVLLIEEPNAWALQTLRANKRRMILSDRTAQVWRAPLRLRVEIEDITLATPRGPILRHAITPIAPSGANGMALCKMAARIVRVMGEVLAR